MKRRCKLRQAEGMPAAAAYSFCADLNSECRVGACGWDFCTLQKNIYGFVSHAAEANYVSESTVATMSQETDAWLCCCKFGVLFVGVLIMRALSFWVYVRAPDVCKLPLGRQRTAAGASAHVFQTWYVGWVSKKFHV